MDQRQRFENIFGPRYSQMLENAPQQRYAYSDDTLRRASDVADGYVIDNQVGSAYDREFLRRMIDRYGPRAGVMMNSIAQSFPMPRRDYSAGLLSADDYEDIPMRMEDRSRGEIMRVEAGHIRDLVQRYGLLGLIGMTRGLND